MSEAKRNLWRNTDIFVKLKISQSFHSFDDIE